MADDRISIILEAIDNASGPLQGLANNIASMAGQGVGALGNVAVALGGVGLAAGGAALAGVVALGKAGVDAWGEMDTASDTLMQKTGATGEALDGMTASVMDLRASAAGLDVDTQTIAETMATLSQRVGLTGEALEGTTGGVLEFSKIMGGDAKANTEALSGVLKGFNVDAEDSGAALDIAFVAAQKFGVQGNELLGSLDRFGPTLRQMGLGLEESASLLGSLGAAGLDGDKAMAAITKSAAGFAKEGLSVRDGLTQAITAIAGATSETEAMTIAADTFGSKAAVTMVDGIRSGKITVDSLTGSLGDTTGALHTATEAALDAPDKWKMGMTQIQNALVPVGEAVMGLAAEIMPMVSEVITTTVVPALRNLGAWLKDNLPGAIATMKDVWNGLQPAFQAVMAFVTGTVVPALATLGAWLKDNLPGAIATLVSFWQGTLWPALQTVGAWVQGTLFPILSDLFTWIATNLPPAIQTLADFWQGTLWPALQTVGAWVQGTLVPILSDLFTWIATNLPPAIQTLADFWNTKLKPALEAVWAFIKDPLAPLLKTLVEIVGTTLKIAVEVLLAVWDKLQPALKVVGDYISATFDGLLTGIKTTFENLSGPINWVNQRLGEFKKALEGLSLPDWLVRRSPSPIEQTFAGLADVTPQATDTLRAFGAAVGVLDAASLNVDAVESLAAAMRMLTQIMGAPGMGVEPGSNDEERINTMSDALGKIASALKNVVDAIRLIDSEAGQRVVSLVDSSRATLNTMFDILLAFGRDLAQRAGAAQATYSATTIAALQSLGDVLQKTGAVLTATIGIVQTFLDDVNNDAMLGALGSVAARNWIVDLVALIVTWGDQIAAAVAQVEMTADTRVTPALGKLGDLLNAVKGVFETTVGVVLTFLDDVNNARFLGALGSFEARAWIVELAALIVTWGNQIGDAVDDVRVTVNNEVAPKLAELAALLKASTDVLTTTVEAVETLIDIGKKGPPSIDPQGAAQLVIRPLVAIAQGLANEIADAMGTWSQVPPASAALSKMVQEGVGVLTTTVEAVQTLIDLGKQGFPTIDPAGVGDLLIKPLVLIARGLAKQIQDALGAWKPGDLPLQQLSDTVSNMVEVIDGVIDLLTRLAKPDIEFLFYGTPEQTAEKIMLLNGHMIDVLVIVGKALADRIKAAVGAWQSSDLPLSGLSSMVGDMVSVIDGVVDLLTRLAKPDIEFLFYGTPQQTAEKILLLNGHMIDVLVIVAKALADRIQAALGAVEVEASPALGALSTVLSDFLDLIGNVTELAKELAAPPTLPNPSEELDLWIADAVIWARGVGTAAQEAAYGYALLAEYGLADLATAISDALGVLTTVADLVAYFADPPALPKPSEALDLWIADAVIWARGVGTAAQEAAYGYRVLADEGLKELADALGDTLSVLKDTLDLAALAGKADAFDPARLGVLRDKMLAALPVIVQIARDFAQQASASGITEAWSAAAQVLADAMGSAVGAIRDALDLGGLLNDPDTRIPTKDQIAGKVAAVLDVVDVAVAAFGARASAAAAGGLDVKGLADYAGAVKGVFEAIGEVANAVKSFTGIYTGPGIGQNSGFANIKATLDQIFALFEDAAGHSTLVAGVTSTLTVALDGVTALAGAKGTDAGNAWLAGFQGAIGSGQARGTGTALGPGGQAQPQIVNNYVTNNTKSMVANVNATTSEAGRGAVMSAFSMVMY